VTAPLLQLPVSVGSAAGWQLSDYRELTIVSQPAAAGSATAYGPQLDVAELWLIDHAVCSCTSAAQTDLRLYGGQVSPGSLLDGSASGNFDVSDWPNGLQLQPTRQLVAVWTGADAGSVGTLTLQCRVLRRVG
jgi:hypothetical protein